jgi:hypothetical protein
MGMGFVENGTIFENLVSLGLPGARIPPSEFRPVYSSSPSAVFSFLLTPEKDVSHAELQRFALFSGLARNRTASLNQRPKTLS